MHNHTDVLIGSAEAANRLGVDRATFNRWVAAGRITAVVKFPGEKGARLFDPADVEQLKAGSAA